MLIIEHNFGKVLKSIGVSDSETCILDQYDNDARSFHCHFNNKDEDAIISLVLACSSKFPKVIIDYQDMKKVYEYDRKDKMTLVGYTVENNGNTFIKKITYDDYCIFILKNDEYSLKIKLYSNESKINSVKNEEELKQYLLGLKFPLDIVNVYKKISVISQGISKYTKMELKLKKRNSKGKKKTTDFIWFFDGEFKTIMRTKDGKTMRLDNKGNWRVVDAFGNVVEESYGECDFDINPKIKSTISLKDQYDMALENVDNLKKDIHDLAIFDTGESRKKQL